MVDLIFKVKTTETLYLSDEWLSNGHWMIKRKDAHNMIGTRKHLRGLKEILKIKEGRYVLGKNKAPIPGPFPNFAIPDIEAGPRTKLWLSNEVRWRNGKLRSIALLNNKGNKIFVNPVYYALFEPFKLYGDGDMEPVLVRNKLDQDIGCIMPMRERVY